MTDFREVFKSRLTPSSYDEIVQFYRGNVSLLVLSEKARGILDSLNKEAVYRSYEEQEILFELSEKLKEDEDIETDEDFDKFENGYRAFVLGHAYESAFFNKGGPKTLVGLTKKWDERKFRSRF